MDVFQSHDIAKEKSFKKRSLYNRMHFPDNKYLNKILSIFPSQIMSRPLMIHIETVNTCNHNCIFCAYELQKDEKKVMPMDLFSKIISDYVNMGGGPISLTPTPGEIFLDPLLEKRLQLLERFPQVTAISITTNGIGSEKIGDTDLRYLLSRFERIHISVYGLDANEYQQITRRHTFDQCISSIKRIIAFSRPGSVIFGFRLLYHRTDHEISEWIYNTFGRDIYFGYTLEYCTWGLLIKSNLKELPGDARWKNMPAITTPCFRPLITIKVCVTGDVSLCCCGDRSAHDLILGSVLDASLEAMYNSEKCKKFWNSGKNIPDTCKNCTTYISFEYFNPMWFEKPIEYIGG